ncbi:hypothetical protein IQ221_17340 [Synechocystis salina LEGE 00041]|nr:hypothetical protein [Synechocystis salina LEGE 00041]
MAKETMPDPAQSQEHIPPNQPPRESVPTAPTVVTTTPLVPEEIKEKPPVVGQVYINQLLLTLFPERRYSGS